jgi:hypothetical protein
MNDYSNCCGAERHHIWDDLCSECLEHFCEAEEEK